MNDKEAGLEKLLGDLAAHYNNQNPPAGALDRLKRRLKTESRSLSDNDLDWLAAAGTAGESPPPKPDDESNG